MKLLAVETSTPSGSVALVEFDKQKVKVLGEITVYSEKSHSERLLPSIDSLLAQCEIDISDIDFFAASIGPGSFTGLRIGLSTIKAFAYAHNKKVVGIPTLEAMSHPGLFHSGPVCPFLDAGRGELYAALYQWGGASLLPVSLQKQNDLISKLREFQKHYHPNQRHSDQRHPERSFAWRSEGSPAELEKILLLGDISLLEEKLLDQRIFKWGNASPRASSVAQLAIRKIEQGADIDPGELLPLYVRIPQAEANLR